jgi:hypothetical protein
MRQVEREAEETMMFGFIPRRHARTAIGPLTLGILLSGSAAANAKPQGHPSLAGVWTLVAADTQSPDGKRSPEYGEHPKGRLMIDSEGRYSLQIYDPRLANFAADEEQPSPREYHDAMEAASTHYGTVSADWAKHLLRFSVDGALYPNLRGSVQLRPFKFDGKVLSYRIPPTPQGVVRISEWRRDSQTR